jgi:hypothetical protein
MHITYKNGKDLSKLVLLVSAIYVQAITEKIKSIIKTFNNSSIVKQIF